MIERKETQRYKFANANDARAKRINQKNEVDTETFPEEPANRPQGNYEYEQMIAEKINSDVRHSIEEAAFYIAMRHGFVAGNEMADWLQAETEIQASLHKTTLDHCNKATAARGLKSLRAVLE